MAQKSLNEKNRLHGQKRKNGQSLQNKKLFERNLRNISILCQTIKETVQELLPLQNIDKLNKNSLEETVKEYEVTIIKSALIICSGNQEEAAKLLKSRVSRLNAKIEKYAILQQN